MALTARFTKPVQVVEEPAMLARIKAVADAEGISLAQVLRDLVRHGIRWREELSRERLGA